ncbi:hypothetical protein SD77_3257 [Bacillus badius]|uniref:Uncharacterized protein n=1 Tax=Bacillus badius TaxID=1455 RepID=A0ABR5AXC2_BACBA|nr:hypothetical protein SD78_0150 [Bacillus badius]KIL79391.1 hypothetical protein SD77_3257 [Bacillus badius]
MLFFYSIDENFGKWRAGVCPIKKSALANDRTGGFMEKRDMEQAMVYSSTLLRQCSHSLW